MEIPYAPGRAGRQTYQGFVDLLYKRKRAAGLQAQTINSLQEYGGVALAAAENPLQQLHTLIDRQR